MHRWFFSSFFLDGDNLNANKRSHVHHKLNRKEFSVNNDLIYVPFLSQSYNMALKKPEYGHMED